MIPSLTWLMPLLMMAGGSSSQSTARIPQCKAVFCVAPGYRAEVGKDIPHSAWHDALGVLFSGRLFMVDQGGRPLPISRASFLRGGRTVDGKFCAQDDKEMEVTFDSEGRFKTVLFTQRAHAFPILEVPRDCELEIVVLIRSEGCDDLTVEVGTQWEAPDLELKCKVRR
ncbi:MAG: hypothetical protein HY510_03245 [Acidobacteria bacterium]|nr:hypothetical protein [Acidobacteriota bacterium]